CRGAAPSRTVRASARPCARDDPRPLRSAHDAPAAAGSARRKNGLKRKKGTARFGSERRQDPALFASAAAGSLPESLFGRAARIGRITKQNFAYLDHPEKLTS